MKQLSKKPSTIKKIYRASLGTSQPLPLAISYVPAGFPSPADDYIEHALDLNEHLIKHPAASFFVRVQGDSMINAGIRSGDLLLIDRALEPQDKSVIIAHLNGEFTIKRITKKNSIIQLVPENDAYQAITVTVDMDFEVWGVVTHVIHTVT